MASNQSKERFRVMALKGRERLREGIKAREVE